MERCYQKCYQLYIFRQMRGNLSNFPRFSSFSTLCKGRYTLLINSDKSKKVKNSPQNSKNRRRNSK